MLKGEARISVFHAIPADVSVDVLAGDDTLIQGLFYPDLFEGTGDGYATVDVVAGVYELSVVAGDGSFTLNAGETTMGAGRHYLIAAINVANDPLFVLKASDIPQ